MSTTQVYNNKYNNETKKNNDNKNNDTDKAEVGSTATDTESD